MKRKAGKSAAPVTSGQVLMREMEKELNPAKELLGKYFSREETRESATAYFLGLLTKTERKNSWQLSEQAGHENPYAFQYLLGRALWDENLLRDDTREQNVSHLGKKDSVLSVDETGFLKKGNKSAGVGRQYSGTAGRIENCQIGVFLSYATLKGRALIDRELYIPRDWTENRDRCHRAGIPAERGFMTKPELALVMLQRAFEAGVKPEWVAGDEVYGCHKLRGWLELQEQGYVLAVASNSVVWIGLEQFRVTEFLNNVSEKEWKLLSAGAGTKGERYYEWHRKKINSESPVGWSRWLLIRRNIKKPGEVAFYIAFCSDKKSLSDMAKAAGTRWTVEECFEMAKGETGLDHYEVRSWKGWYRHITFSMFALSFLVRLRTRLNEAEIPAKKKMKKRSTMRNFLKTRGLVA